MGRHSDPHDTAGIGAQLNAAATTDGLDTPGGSESSAELWEALELPTDDDVALWDFEPFLRRERPHVTVELPEADQ
jgi:hypothetical protein